MSNTKLGITFASGLELEYNLHDSEVARMWANKIKHLQNVPFDPVESKAQDMSDLSKIYTEFCEFAGQTPIEIHPLDQSKCNQLHQIYEEQHDRLSKLKNNSVLYRFHHAIHQHENKPDKPIIRVGWGTNEGILTSQFLCQDYYADKIEKNNIYLPWSELGKTPLTYWIDKEPDTQERFNTLAKTHKTFRAQFFIAIKNIEPKALDTDFLEWFDRYKEGWLKHHNIKKWDHIDEHSAPLLATTSYQGDLTGMTVNKLTLC